VTAITLYYGFLPVFSLMNAMPRPIWLLCMATVAVDLFWCATCHVIEDGFHTDLGFFWVTGEKQIDAQYLPNVPARARWDQDTGLHSGFTVCLLKLVLTSVRLCFAPQLASQWREDSEQALGRQQGQEDLSLTQGPTKSGASEFYICASAPLRVLRSFLPRQPFHSDPLVDSWNLTRNRGGSIER
jgi:hypothetical protein